MTDGVLQMVPGLNDITDVPEVRFAVPIQELIDLIQQPETEPAVLTICGLR